MKSIKILSISELLIFLTSFISFGFFINMQVAFLSSFFIIIGSAYAYRKMVKTKVKLEDIEDKREFFYTLEDPHELYDETPINEAPVEELDLKAIVKEEKKKIKMLNMQDMKKGAKAGFSLFRLVPYLFLVLGFIALKNNDMLEISIYLPSLLVGIIIGYIVSRDIFNK